MADHIQISPAPGTWVVRARGAVLVESDNALELREGDYPPVIYFPRDDVAMELLDRSPKSTHCPHKGDASYFSIAARTGTLENAAWSYEAPFDGVSEIRDYLAFYPSPDLAIEQV